MVTFYWISIKTPEDLCVFADVFDNEITVYLPVDSKKVIIHLNDTEEAI